MDWKREWYVEPKSTTSFQCSALECIPGALRPKRTYMGRDRYKIVDNQYPYFVTLTAIKWLPILGKKQVREILVSSMQHLQENRGATIYAYVLMENHVHMIIRVENLAEVIARFKSFTARKIIDLLQDTRQTDVLEQLSFFKGRHKVDRDYQLWQEGMHPVQIDSREKMRQKVEYIHMNPVRRGYVDDPVHWAHSSARTYNGMDGVLEVATEW